MRVPVQSLLEYPPDYRNPADELVEDTLCDVCKAGGNVQRPRLRVFEDIPDDERPIAKADGVYMWDFPTLRRNKRCPLCRLVWRTFQPFYEAVKPVTPGAVLGVTKRAEARQAEKWIKLTCMVARNTMDNRDISGSGQVYIYEDERVPEYGIYALATQPMPDKADWCLSQQIHGDLIDFDLLTKWISTCESEHGPRCSQTSGRDMPARRLIDVEQSCVVDGSSSYRYMTLSYVWGSISQFMLEKIPLGAAKQKGFFDSPDLMIPQTIRDAIVVCRKLGVRHLWVDALCIVQGDEEEQSSQMAQMDAIYGRAVTTIICASGEDANARVPELGGSRRQMASYTETVDGQELITSLASTTAAAQRSVWNTRASTFPSTSSRLSSLYSQKHMYFFVAVSPYGETTW